MTEEEIWAARKERASRWAKAGGELRGYPALAAEAETAESLHAEPPEHGQKKPKATHEPAA
jgi:hypothetical protein